MNSENTPKIVATTIYIVVIVFVILLFVSIVISILQPTFFPDTDISGFKDIIQTSNALLGLSSVILAIYSVFQSRKGNAETNKILEEIRNLRSDVNTALNKKPETHVSDHAEIGDKADVTG